MSQDSGGWDDDDLGGGIERGGAAGHAAGESAYSGGGMGLGDDDDPFADEIPAGALELDVPASHAARSSRSIPAAEPPPDVRVPSKVALPVPHGAVSQAPRGGNAPATITPDGPSSLAFRAAAGAPSASLPTSSAVSNPPAEAAPSLEPPSVRRADPAAMIARYPAVPPTVWGAPGYAIKVVLRQFELREDIAALRKKRSPDVALYERALKTHDAKTFTVGLVITLAACFVASFLFFLPVILRFLRAPE
jgi:hypothetical protein